MNELKFQKKIIDEVKRFNRLSYAIKLNNRFLAGVPDLLIKVPGYDPLFVEVKVGKMSRDHVVKIGTTAIQRSTMKKMEQSGLKTAVWTLVENGASPFILQTMWYDVTATVGLHNSLHINLHKKWNETIECLLMHPVGLSHLDTDDGM